ncbi:MAG: ATP-binding protein [Myxococcota bacterium]
MSDGLDGKGDDDLIRVIGANVPGTVYLCRNDATYSMHWLTEDVEALTGWAASEFVSGAMNFVALYHPDDVAMIEEEVAAALAQRRPYVLRYRLRHRDATYRHVEEHGQGVWDESGALAFLAGNVLDVTEQVEMRRRRAALEKRLKRAEKLESLGLLAGGIAHDFNNLLVTILGNTEVVRERLAPESQEVELLDQVLQASGMAARLVRRVLSVAGEAPEDASIVDLRQLGERTFDIVRASQPGEVVLAHEGTSSPLLVSGDAAQLQQLLLNVMVNACEALPAAGGRVWLRTRPVMLGVPDTSLEWVFPHDGALLGAHAEVEVEDEGVGIAPDALTRIFDPFYSTKPEGYGLGLASVVGTVRGHGGGLAIRSEVGRGTVMRVYVPLDAPASGPQG